MILSTRHAQYMYSIGTLNIGNNSPIERVNTIIIVTQKIGARRKIGADSALRAIMSPSLVLNELWNLLLSNANERGRQ